MFGEPALMETEGRMKELRCELATNTERITSGKRSVPPVTESISRRVDEAEACGSPIRRYCHHTQGYAQSVHVKMSHSINPGADKFLAIQNHFAGNFLTLENDALALFILLLFTTFNTQCKRQV